MFLCDLNRTIKSIDRKLRDDLLDDVNIRTGDINHRNRPNVGEADNETCEIDIVFVRQHTHTHYTM